jgi:hypothetical protein
VVPDPLVFNDDQEKKYNDPNLFPFVLELVEGNLPLGIAFHNIISSNVFADIPCPKLGRA